MDRTDDLVVALAGDAEPVRRLAPPLAVFSRWGGLALAGIVVFVLVMGVRPDLLQCLSQSRYLMDMAGALATAAGAAWAAAISAWPGRPAWQRLLPAAPAAFWIGSLVAGAWADGGPLRPDLICLPMIMGLTVLPCAALVLAMRSGEVLAPCQGLFLAVAASASVAYAGLRLVHPEDAGRMVLIWQFGPVLLLSTMAACLGERVFSRKFPKFLKNGPKAGRSLS